MAPDGMCCAVGLLLYGHVPQAERFATMYADVPEKERPKKRICWAEPEHKALIERWKLLPHEITDMLIVNEDFKGTPDERRAHVLAWLERKLTAESSVVPA